MFLARFIGTQEKEDISYIEANKLNLVATLTTCLCSILEIGLYFAYNELVNSKHCIQITSSFDVCLGASMDPHNKGRHCRNPRKREFKGEGRKQEKREKGTG